MLRCSGGSVRAFEETSRSPTMDLAVGRLQETGDQPQRRGLAATRWPQQADQLPVLDPQRDVIDHGKRAKSLGQAAQINGRQSDSSRFYCAGISAPAFLPVYSYKH